MVLYRLHSSSCTYIIACFCFSTLENLDESLLDQLKIYQKSKESDEEELETPGGIKLNQIENVSKFLVDKVTIKEYTCMV